MNASDAKEAQNNLYHSDQSIANQKSA